MARTAERAKLNALKRYRSPDDPEVLKAAAALKAGRIEDHIKTLVDAAPPLSAEQKVRLAALLIAPSGAGGDGS
jgi:hypothetical protein